MLVTLCPVNREHHPEGITSHCMKRIPAAQPGEEQPGVQVLPAVDIGGWIVALRRRTSQLPTSPEGHSAHLSCVPHQGAHLLGRFQESYPREDDFLPFVDEKSERTFLISWHKDGITGMDSELKQSQVHADRQP
jgi:hypothetical protein